MVQVPNFGSKPACPLAGADRDRQRLACWLSPLDAEVEAGHQALAGLSRF